MRVLLVIAAAIVATVFSWWYIGEMSRDLDRHRVQRGLLSLILGTGAVNTVFWLTGE